MTTDAEYVAERRRLDERTYMIKACDPAVAPLLAPAVLAVRTSLADGRWHAHPTMLAVILHNSDVAVKTADSLLRRACLAGLIERRGEYVRALGGRPSRDGREWGWIDGPQ